MRGRTVRTSVLVVLTAITAPAATQAAPKLANDRRLPRRRNASAPLPPLPGIGLPTLPG